MKASILSLLTGFAVLPALVAADCPGSLTLTVPPPPCLVSKIAEVFVA